MSDQLPALSNARNLDEVMRGLPAEQRAMVRDALESSAKQPMGDFVAVAAAKILAEILPPERVATAVRSLSANFALIAKSSHFLAKAMETPTGRHSVAAAVAMTAITGYAPGVPGAPGAKAWIIPRMSGGCVTVNWQISAAGLRSMAEEDGYLVTAASIFAGDLLLLPSIDNPTALCWEAVPGGPCADPGDHEPPWAPIPVDDAAPLPPAHRRAQPARAWQHLAGFLVTARRVGSSEIRTWRLVGRDVILARRAASDAYIRALKEGKLNSNTWGQWPLEMAEKAAIAYALRRGLVTLSDRMTAVLRADHDRQVIDTTAEPEAPPTRARIIVPETTRALPAPSLDDLAEPTAEERAEIERAERGGK